MALRGESAGLAFSFHSLCGGVAMFGQADHPSFAPSASQSVALGLASVPLRRDTRGDHAPADARITTVLEMVLRELGRQSR